MSRFRNQQKSSGMVAFEEQQTELKSTYHDSFGGSGGFMSPPFKSSGKELNALSPVPPTNALLDGSRLTHLENQLNNQERTIQTLIGKFVLYR